MHTKTATCFVYWGSPSDRNQRIIGAPYILIKLLTNWTLFLPSNKQKLKRSVCWSQGIEWHKNQKYKGEWQPLIVHLGATTSTLRAWHQGPTSLILFNRVCGLSNMQPRGAFKVGLIKQLPHNFVAPRIGGMHSFRHSTQCCATRVSRLWEASAESHEGNGKAKGKLRNNSSYKPASISGPSSLHTKKASGSKRLVWWLS